MTQNRLVCKGGSARFVTWRRVLQQLAIRMPLGPTRNRAGTSAAYDLHQKKGAYRRNGVSEYLAWITGEHRLVWWQLREGEYQEIAPDAHGLLRSRVFPGLWLDTRALLSGDMKTVLISLRQGFESPEHAAFLAR